MVNYQNGKIYKITSPNTEKVYIGSTCIDLDKRLKRHINDYKIYLEGKRRYITSFEIIKENDCEITLLENVNCNNKKELHLKERKYIDEIKCVNKFKPLRGVKEWYKDNRVRLLEKQKKYQQKNRAKRILYIQEYERKNKDKIEARKSEKITCVCGVVIRKDSKARHIKSKKHITFMEQKNI